MNEKKAGGYAALAEEIVKRAAKSYKTALKRGDDKKAAELEKFFLSPYGQILSFNNGVRIVEHIKSEVYLSAKVYNTNCASKQKEQPANTHQ